MIALFGGSFNPIHLGHTSLARWLVSEGYAEKAWLMVSPQNPLKAQPDLAAENLRLRWAQLACEEVEGVEAVDFEFRLPRPSYTWQTLTALTETYRDERFALVIGADNWLDFSKWARHEWIVEHFPLLVYPRPGFPIEESTLPDSVTLVPSPLFPFSSTAIRQRLREGKSVKTMLPHAVWEAMKKEGFTPYI